MIVRPSAIQRSLAIVQPQTTADPPLQNCSVTVCARPVQGPMTGDVLSILSEEIVLQEPLKNVDVSVLAGGDKRLTCPFQSPYPRICLPPSLPPFEELDLPLPRRSIRRRTGKKWDGIITDFRVMMGPSKDDTNSEGFSRCRDLRNLLEDIERNRFRHCVEVNYGPLPVGA